MFSSTDIVRNLNKTIMIEPYTNGQLNINSYDVCLWHYFYLLLPDSDREPCYFGPLCVADGCKVLVPSGMTLLGATRERIASYGDVLVQLRSKSTTRRTGITVCDDAGFGDVGYANHWTVELTAHAPGGVYLTVGARFAQVLFQRTEMPPIKAYDGQYNADDWPICMIPKAYRGSVKAWKDLHYYDPAIALLPWVKPLLPI